MVHPWLLIPAIFAFILHFKRNCSTKQFCVILHVDNILDLAYSLHRPFITVFVRSSEAWMVPFAKRIIQQSIALTRDAQFQLVSEHAYDTTSPYEIPAQFLRRLINSVMSDRSGTKKSIIYYIGNQLFRCYFRVFSAYRYW
jgi:hypothetical protein